MTEIEYIPVNYLEEQTRHDEKVLKIILFTLMCILIAKTLELVFLN